VTTDYIGCAANVSLLPNEVYIVQERERIIRYESFLINELDLME